MRLFYLTHNFIKTNFNSHTPHGVRLTREVMYNKYRNISTHTPHTGCDKTLNLEVISLMEFQLTHPTRGATYPHVEVNINDKFQLTHPTRGATVLLRWIVSSIIEFQLTHPTRGATANNNYNSSVNTNFNSHTPHGVRPCFTVYYEIYQYFNSHTPHGVRRFAVYKDVRRVAISTHTPHTGCDPSNNHT